MMIEDEELRHLYITASEERLQKLEVGLQHLQKHPDDEALLEELRREAHSLKGDSRSLGIETVETVAYQLEEILASIKHQQTVLTPLLSDRLDRGLAAIGRLVQEAVTGQPSGINTDDVLVQLMEAVLESQVPQQDAAFAAEKAPQLALTFIEDEELRNLYVTASEERLQKLEVGLRHLQKHPDDEAVLEELRREAHSLKGDSRSVGIETVEALAHQLEEILGRIKHQQAVLTPQVSDRVYQALAAISLLVQETATGQPSGIEPDGVLEQLMEAVLELDSIRDRSQHTDEAFPPDSRVSGQLQQETPPKKLPGERGSGGAGEQEFIPSIRGAIAARWGTPNKNDVPQLAPTVIEDEELREIYKIASEERLQTLQAGLLHLEKHPDDEATLEQLLREAHTLKGDSRSAGLETVETLTHALEEILESIKHQQTILTPQVSDRLYQGLDTLGLLVREAVTGQASGVDLVGAIEQLMEVVATPPIQESLPAADERSLTTTEEQSSPLPSSFEPVPSTTPSLSAESLAIATPDLPSPSPGVGEPYRIDTIRVPTHDLDALLTQAEELTVTKIAIAHATTEIEAMVALWEEWRAVYSKGKSLNSSSLAANPYLERLEKTLHSLRTSSQENITKLDMISGELREKIRTLRLLPLSTLFQLFPRMVRDLARQQSKQVELIIEGGETTADKRILEEIKDSLMHMIRNAIDHGIETADERERLGKPPIAKIWLRGYQSGNSIVIEVADDGRGLDTEKIKQTAIKRKLYRAEELETMAPSQLHALIFAPGFSTRTFITEISGRGIGLDVVRTNVERLKGTIQIESTLGQGCIFRLQLSTTLAIVNALLLEVRGIIHALPIEFVHTSLLVSQDQILTKDGRETIIVDGQIVPVADLGELLELSNSPIYASVAKGNPQKSELRQTILLKVGEEQAGFFVDRLLDTQEVAIKPQSQVLKRVRNVSGATILPSGDVCTILNPPDLLRSLQQQTPSATSIKPKETVQKKPVILLVEDSIPVRTQEKRLLEGAGYEVVIAVDGLDGYNKLRSRDFDAVVSDVEMPNLNGFSLTAKIRKHPEYKNLPIILVTTLTSDADKSKGAKAGADAYIIKGKFNQDFLLETLGRLV